MKFDATCFILGATVTVAAAVVGKWAYDKAHTVEVKDQIAKAAKRVKSSMAKSARVRAAMSQAEIDDGMTPCQRAARERAAAQGAVGTIPLSYGDAPMSLYEVNPDRRL